jgi:hypothetical protein
MSAKDKREVRGAWGPGEYFNSCFECDETFIGDKRALSCAPCAYRDNGRDRDTFTAGHIAEAKAERERVLTEVEEICGRVIGVWDKTADSIGSCAVQDVLDLIQNLKGEKKEGDSFCYYEELSSDSPYRMGRCGVSRIDTSAESYCPGCGKKSKFGKL